MSERDEEALQRIGIPNSQKSYKNYPTSLVNSEMQIKIMLRNCFPLDLLAKTLTF